MRSKNLIPTVVATALTMGGVASAATTIIGGTIGNGNFEDFSGAFNNGSTGGINGTSPDYTRVWENAEQDSYGIDGWTASWRSGYVSFDTRTDTLQVGAGSATPNKSFNLNQWSQAILTSDTYNHTISPNDEVTFDFDYAGNLLRLNVIAVFDEGLASEWTHYFVGSNAGSDTDRTDDFVGTDHTQLFNAGGYSYTLGAGESASTVSLVIGGYRADQGGADYGMIKRNGGTGIVDNVVLEVVPEPSVALLGAFGLLGLLRRRR